MPDFGSERSGLIAGASSSSRALRCLVAISLLGSAIASASDSELNVGVATLQRLVTDHVFGSAGRWQLLDDGPCYAYLEYPKVRLSGGRLLLDAHLSSRIGARVGGYCAGSGFASNVTLSGQATGHGTIVTLADIRIDHVDDGATRAVLELVQEAAPRVLPSAVSLDVLANVRGAPINAAGIPISVTRFQILAVATRTDGVNIRYELVLSAP